jgi:3-oxoacid CoA-transferase subunit A
MSILLSGDFHAGMSGEMYAINKKTLLRKYRREKYKNIKYHVILGDGSFMWPDNQKNDEKVYAELARRPFPVLCVIGNHEPILGMDNVPETDIGIGETVYQIRNNPFVAYLKRGKIYTIDSFKCLVLGGALSVDKKAHIPKKTWWEREYWTEQEKQDLLTLIKNDNIFDCVLSHTGPEHMNKMILCLSSPFNTAIPDEVGELNDQIDAQVQCREWFCGHLHRDEYFYDTNAKKGYQYLYRTTKILDRVDNQIVVYNEFGKTVRNT